METGNLGNIRVPTHLDSSLGSSDQSSISTDVTERYDEDSLLDTSIESTGNKSNVDIESDVSSGNLDEDLEGIVPMLEASVLDDKDDQDNHKSGK